MKHAKCEDELVPCRLAAHPIFPCAPYASFQKSGVPSWIPIVRISMHWVCVGIPLLLETAMPRLLQLACSSRHETPQNTRSFNALPVLLHIPPTPLMSNTLYKFAEAIQPQGVWNPLKTPLLTLCRPRGDLICGRGLPNCGTSAPYL